MRPMSLWESDDSTEEISLSALFDGTDEVSGHSRVGVDELAHLVCRGERRPRYGNSGWNVVSIQSDRMY